MKITNKHNLPDALVRVMENDDHVPSGADISVTSLLQPPQIRVLKKKHDDEIEMDIAECSRLILGKSLHSLAEIGAMPEDKCEELLFSEVLGWKVSAVPDLLQWKPETESYHLIDYKCASVWTLIFDPKWEWVAQLNCYAEIARQNGYIVNSAELVVFADGWDARKAERERDYPGHPIGSIPIDLWQRHECIAYMERRVGIHRQAQNGESVPCTPADQWAEPDKWAVYANGRNKRAMRVFQSEAEAAQLLAEIEDEGRIEFRPGRKKRCEDWCLVGQFCEQHKREQKNAANEERVH